MKQPTAIKLPRKSDNPVGAIGRVGWNRLTIELRVTLMSNILLFKVPSFLAGGEDPPGEACSADRELIEDIRRLLELHAKARSQIDAAILLIYRGLKLIREEITVTGSASIRARFEHDIQCLEKQLEIARQQASDLLVLE